MKTERLVFIIGGVILIMIFIFILLFGYNSACQRDVPFCLLAFDATLAFYIGIYFLFKGVLWEDLK